MKKWLSALLCAAMLLSLCACGAVSEPAATAEPTAAVTAAPAEETVEREYIECSGGYAYTEFVPMDDGAEICLLIVKPEKEGQFPTVITQNCYQAATEEFNAEYIEKCVSDSSAFVEAGYTFVMMQTRGTATARMRASFRISTIRTISSRCLTGSADRTFTMGRSSATA